MKLKAIFISIIACFLMSTPIHANVILPAIFGNNMVLQQKFQTKLWGWGKPGETITITASWDSHEYETVVDNQTNWEIFLSTPKAGGPYSIEVKGYNTILIENVLIGEVWLCSGQSNMEWSARMGIDNAEAEIAKANYPEIRFFTVMHQSSEHEKNDVHGSWQVCTPQSMIDFSAAAYFFARELQQELNIPIGIVNASWGGSPAEGWVPQSAIENNAVLAKAAEKIEEMEWCPREPGRLYNAMIAPLTNFTIAGVIWYQGETNTANPDTYHILLQTLIDEWRDAWDLDFPFYFAQIAPYVYQGDSGVRLQNAQRKTQRVDNTAMIVTNDIAPDVQNIHPTNKLDVGKRFAHVALNLHYNKANFPVSGPMYRSNKVDGSKIIVYFDYAQGLKNKTKTIEGFEIAGLDGKFVPAQAKIVGTSVELSSKQIKTPAYVRYAWSNTAKPQLTNSFGLPASCFTTQD